MGRRWQDEQPEPPYDFAYERFEAELDDKTDWVNIAGDWRDVTEVPSGDEL